MDEWGLTADGHDAEQGDEEAGREHDHRHTQAEADDHQDESDGHGATWARIKWVFCSH